MIVNKWLPVAYKFLFKSIFSIGILVIKPEEKIVLISILHNTKNVFIIFIQFYETQVTQEVNFWCMSIIWEPLNQELFRLSEKSAFTLIIAVLRRK